MEPRHAYHHLSTDGMKRSQLLFHLFISFFKIGPVTFGGGYAMIPLIEREVVDKRKWISSRDVAEIFAVAESVPGAIAINSATFIGYRLAGPLGAVVAMGGVLLPTFIVMVLLSVFFLIFRDNPTLSAAFEAIRAAIVALIAYAAVKIGRTAIIDKTTISMVAATVLILLLIHIHPVMIIIGGAVLGIGVVRLRSALGLETKLDAAEEEYIYKDYFIGDGI